MPLPAAILQTVLIRLGALFLVGANGDEAAARLAASQMLDAYHLRTVDELRVAANLICHSFQALEALSQAAAPGLPITRVLRLRGGAVSLSRESAKAERRLGQLQNNCQQPVPEQQPEAQPEPALPEPKIEKAVALIQQTGTIAALAKANNITWTQAYDKRQRDIRIAASVQRALARNAEPGNAPAQAIPHCDGGQWRRPLLRATSARLIFSG